MLEFKPVSTNVIFQSWMSLASRVTRLPPSLSTKSFEIVSS
jgi:hypothetical protein